MDCGKGVKFTAILSNSNTCGWFLAYFVFARTQRGRRVGGGVRQKKQTDRRAGGGRGERERERERERGRERERERQTDRKRERERQRERAETERETETERIQKDLPKKEPRTSRLSRMLHRKRRPSSRSGS